MKKTCLMLCLVMLASLAICLPAFADEEGNVAGPVPSVGTYCRYDDNGNCTGMLKVFGASYDPTVLYGMLEIVDIKKGMRANLGGRLINAPEGYWSTDMPFGSYETGYNYNNGESKRIVNLTDVSFYYETRVKGDEILVKKMENVEQSLKMDASGTYKLRDTEKVLADKWLSLFFVDRMEEVATGLDWDTQKYSFVVTDEGRVPGLPKITGLCTKIKVYQRTTGKLVRTFVVSLDLQYVYRIEPGSNKASIILDEGAYG